MANSLDHAFFYKSENGDRVYDDASFEHWLKKFFTSGVFLNDLQVTANDDMTVTVGTGYVNADGKVKIFENETTLPVETAGASYPRIDSIVAERNDAERDIILKVITGGYSSEPVAHIPVRQDGVYQLVIGQIYVSAGAVRITQANITDTRSDVDLCGFVASTVDQIDFSQVQTQFDAYFAQYKTQIASDYAEYNEQMESEHEEYSEQAETYLNQMETDFATWFDSIKGQLSEDAAGNLQNQIDELALAEGIEITQAEFDALSETQKNKGTYYITDSDEVTVGEVHQEVENLKTDVSDIDAKTEENATAITQLNSDLGEKMSAKRISIPVDMDFSTESQSFTDTEYLKNANAIVHAVIKCTTNSFSRIIPLSHNAYSSEQLIGLGVQYYCNLLVNWNASTGKVSFKAESNGYDVSEWTLTRLDVWY